MDEVWTFLPDGDKRTKGKIAVRLPDHQRVKVTEKTFDYNLGLSILGSFPDIHKKLFMRLIIPGDMRYNYLKLPTMSAGFTQASNSFSVR